MPRITENLLYTEIKTGELAGATSATQMPDLKCNAVAFFTLTDNTGNVYIGGEGVTVPNGVADSTSGAPLSSGSSSQFIPCRNLNIFYYICDNATDDLVYFALI